jgi:hypothetical protein
MSAKRRDISLVSQKGIAECVLNKGEAKQKVTVSKAIKVIHLQPFSVLNHEDKVQSSETGFSQSIAYDEVCLQ